MVQLSITILLFCNPPAYKNFKYYSLRTNKRQFKIWKSKNFCDEKFQN